MASGRSSPELSSPLTDEYISAPEQEMKELSLKQSKGGELTLEYEDKCVLNIQDGEQTYEYEDECVLNIQVPFIESEDAVDGMIIEVNVDRTLLIRQQATRRAEKEDSDTSTDEYKDRPHDDLAYDADEDTSDDSEVPADGDEESSSSDDSDILDSDDSDLSSEEESSTDEDLSTSDPLLTSTPIKSPEGAAGKPHTINSPATFSEESDIIDVENISGIASFDKTRSGIEDPQECERMGKAPTIKITDPDYIGSQLVTINSSSTFSEDSEIIDVENISGIASPDKTRRANEDTQECKRIERIPTIKISDPDYIGSQLVTINSSSTFSEDTEIIDVENISGIASPDKTRSATEDPQECKRIEMIPTIKISDPDYIGSQLVTINSSSTFSEDSEIIDVENISGISSPDKTRSATANPHECKNNGRYQRDPDYIGSQLVPIDFDDVYGSHPEIFDAKPFSSEELDIEGDTSIDVVNNSQDPPENLDENNISINLIDLEDDLKETTAKPQTTEPEVLENADGVNNAEAMPEKCSSKVSSSSGIFKLPKKRKTPSRGPAANPMYCPATHELSEVYRNIFSMMSWSKRQSRRRKKQKVTDEIDEGIAIKPEYIRGNRMFGRHPKMAGATQMPDIQSAVVSSTKNSDAPKTPEWNLLHSEEILALNAIKTPEDCASKSQFKEPVTSSGGKPRRFRNAAQMPSDYSTNGTSAAVKEIDNYLNPGISPPPGFDIYPQGLSYNPPVQEPVANAAQMPYNYSNIGAVAGNFEVKNHLKFGPNQPAGFDGQTPHDKPRIQSRLELCNSLWKANFYGKYMHDGLTAQSSSDQVSSAYKVQSCLNSVPYQPETLDWMPQRSVSNPQVSGIDHLYREYSPSLYHADSYYKENAKVPWVPDTSPANSGLYSGQNEPTSQLHIPMVPSTVPHFYARDTSDLYRGNPPSHNQEESYYMQAARVGWDKIPVNSGVNNGLNRPSGPIPLPKGTSTVPQYHYQHPDVLFKDKPHRYKTQEFYDMWPAKLAWYSVPNTPEDWIRSDQNRPGTPDEYYGSFPIDPTYTEPSLTPTVQQGYNIPSSNPFDHYCKWPDTYPWNAPPVTSEAASGHFQASSPAVQEPEPQPSTSQSNITGQDRPFRIRKIAFEYPHKFHFINIPKDKDSARNGDNDADTDEDNDTPILQPTTYEQYVNAETCRLCGELFNYILFSPPVQHICHICFQTLEKKEDRTVCTEGHATCFKCVAREKFTVRFSAYTKMKRGLDDSYYVLDVRRLYQ